MGKTAGRERGLAAFRLAARDPYRGRKSCDNRVTAEVDSRILTQLDRYAGCRHQRRRAGRMIRAERADHPGRQSVVLALGSMLVALLVTLVVLKGSPGGAAAMLTALLWVIVAIINVVHTMRRPPRQ